jgi:hypothetical protein
MDGAKSWKSSPLDKTQGERITRAPGVYHRATLEPSSNGRLAVTGRD